MKMCRQRFLTNALFFANIFKKIRGWIPTCESFVVNEILVATTLFSTSTTMAKRRRRRFGHQSCGKHQERLYVILRIGGNIPGKINTGHVVENEW
jgi:hypothetical protein